MIRNGSVRVTDFWACQDICIERLRGMRSPGSHECSLGKPTRHSHTNAGCGSFAVFFGRDSDMVLDRLAPHFKHCGLVVINLKLVQPYLHSGPGRVRLPASNPRRMGATYFEL